MAATPALSVAWVVPDIAAGLVTFGLAAWLWRLTLDEALLFDRVAVRTLSVFLVAHGGAIAFTGLAYTPEAERLADWAIRVGPYFAFAAPLTALAFTVTALTRRGSRAPRAAAWVCGAGALAIWAAYVADPAGPWVVLGGATMVLSLALSAFAFALAASREPDPGRRTGWLLIHFGLLVFSLWHSGWDGVAHLEHLAHGGFAAGAEVILLATPLVAAASIPIALRAHRAGARSPAPTILAAPLLTGVFVGLLHHLGAPQMSFSLGLALDGLWCGVFPAVLAYGFMRRQIFDVDLAAQRGVRRGTVAAVFLVVFLAVGQAAQNLLNESLGWAAGGLAAGLLLFALAPLHEAAGRVASAVLPGARPAGDLPVADRVALYREQAYAAWSDGALDPNERRLLDIARERLGLAADVTTRIEAEAAREAMA